MAIESPPHLLVLHTLRLKGAASVEQVAAYVCLDRPVVLDEIAAAVTAGFVGERRGRFAGFALTDAGRAEHLRLLAAELDDHGLRPRVEAARAELQIFDRQLLDVCEQWEQRTERGATIANDHRDADHDRAVVRALVTLHQHTRPVLASLCEVLDRFALHDARLGYALDRVVAGGHDWFTKSMFPSYRSCWLELHDDLLATLGRERHREGSP